MGDLCGDGNTLLVHVLAMVLHCSFAKCYHWGNWAKRTWDLRVVFLTTANKPAIILKL